MINLHTKINKDFGTLKELVSVNYSCTFDNYMDCALSGCELFRYTANQKLTERKHNELHFHNFLKHQMFSRLQEIKYYSNVNIGDTRRLISTSSDCISTIQILIRDDIHVNVYFRSSDFDHALPADLEFITSLPNELIVHLERFIGTKGYEEIDMQYTKQLREKNIKLNLMFGSLHRTNND